ncbi:MAG: hypothetical protein L6R39_004163 [Caloplaca ligustica]|nr:MAG: hypothetical protein L6R39_004163 [Caloplaca ligustica]
MAMSYASLRTSSFSSPQKHSSSFVKTDFQNRGKDLGGIVWEDDPVRHRAVAKKLSPALSSRSIKALELVAHEHIDYFVAQMKEIGAEPLGVGLMEWTNWLAMDQAADLAWNEKLHQMRHRRLFQRIVHAFYPHVANTCQKEKNSVHLDVLLGFNAFATVMQVFKRFPLLHPLQYLAAPVAKLKALSAMEAAVRDGVLRRIQRTGSTEHVDLFDHVLPADEPIPSDRHELTHIGALAQQMMFANYGPISDWYYGTLLFLLDNPASLQYVSEEIRDRFENYEDITSGALASLPYMHACLEESSTGTVVAVITGMDTDLVPGSAVAGGTHGSNLWNPEDGAFATYIRVRASVTMQLTPKVKLAPEQAATLGTALATCTLAP